MKAPARRSRPYVSRRSNVPMLGTAAYTPRNFGSQVGSISHFKVRTRTALALSSM
jgi:hypothetical protein